MLAQNPSGLVQGTLMQARAPAFLPVFPIPPVDQFRVGYGFHVFECRLVADKILEVADLLDHSQGQGFIVYRNALHTVLDHLRKFTIHHQLAEIKSDAHFQHSQAIDQVGTCQRGHEARQRLFVADLGISDLAVALPTGHKTGQTVVACQAGHGGIDHGAFRTTDSGGGKTQIHCGCGAAIHDRRPFAGELVECH